MLNPVIKIIRDIYINANGIGGVRHPLYMRNKFDRLNNSAPDQHFRTTKKCWMPLSFYRMMLPLKSLLKIRIS